MGLNSRFVDRYRKFTEMFIRIFEKNGERLLNSTMIRSIYRVNTYIYFEYSSTHISPVAMNIDYSYYIKHETEQEAKDAFEKLATKLRYCEAQMK